jgi:hypothetical protein
MVNISFQLHFLLEAFVEGCCSTDVIASGDKAHACVTVHWTVGRECSSCGRDGTHYG